jgi:diaminohydroxyphosphoribosylaminopyrimidine deaminase/5-amino-6-(5-phosphoribosylamino)uracil reductase
LPQHLCEEAQARRITLRGIAQEAGSGFVLADMLGYLRARGVASLLLEGGREVWGSFARAGLVDELFLFQAPQIIGLPQGLHWSQAFITPQALRLEKVQLTVLDDNLLLAAQIEREGNLGETYAS